MRAELRLPYEALIIKPQNSRPTNYRTTKAYLRYIQAHPEEAPRSHTPTIHNALPQNTPGLTPATPVAEPVENPSHARHRHEIGLAPPNPPTPSPNPSPQTTCPELLAETNACEDLSPSIPNIGDVDPDDALAISQPVQIPLSPAPNAWPATEEPQSVFELEQELLVLLENLELGMLSLETFEEETRPQLIECSQNVTASFQRISQLLPRISREIPSHWIEAIDKGLPYPEPLPCEETDSLLASEAFRAAVTAAASWPASPPPSSGIE
jgi:hypothetical protein